MADLAVDDGARLPAHELKKCQSCGHDVWPMQEMTVEGGFFDRCPRIECGATFPAAVKPELKVVPVITAQGVSSILAKAEPGAYGPGLVWSHPDQPIGNSELQYIKLALAECDQLSDIQQIKQKIRRALAMIQ